MPLKYIMIHKKNRLFWEIESENRITISFFFCQFHLALIEKAKIVFAVETISSNRQITQLQNGLQLITFGFFFLFRPTSISMDFCDEWRSKTIYVFIHWHAAIKATKSR